MTVSSKKPKRNSAVLRGGKRGGIETMGKREDKGHRRGKNGAHDYSKEIAFELKRFHNLIGYKTPKEIVEISKERNLNWEEELILASRSFSFPILAMRHLLGQGEADKSKYIGVAYNFARNLDNGGEDSSAPLESKENFFKIYGKNLELLSRAGDSYEVDANYEQAVKGFAELAKVTEPFLLSESEIVFNSNFNSSLEAYKGFPQDIKYAFFNRYREMMNGMIHYLRNPVENFAQLKDYNFKVAGLVGSLLTDIVNIADEVQLASTLAMNMGDYLQNANNIRDVGDDYRLRNRRIIWPSEFFDDVGVEEFMTNPKLKKKRRDALKEMLKNARGSRDSAFDYIFSIPENLRSYRAFCLTPVVLADKTYDKIGSRKSVLEEEVYNLKGGVKIDKEIVINTMGFITRISSLDREDGGNRLSKFVEDYKDNPDKYTFESSKAEVWASPYLNKK